MTRSKKTDAIVETLHRVKRRIEKDRAFAIRVWKSAQERGDSLASERAAGEANVLMLAMRHVDAEINKLRSRKT